MKTIFMIVALATSFMSGQSDSSAKRTTEYHWFDTAGNFLYRTSTIGIEAAYTGYDNNTGNPKTLREKGFNPSNCSGWPVPVPNDFDLPDVLIYSHP